MRNQYLRFWLKLALYVFPFAVGFLALTGALVYIGESMPLRWVVWHQQRDDVLFRYRYGNRDLDFKQLSVNVRQPEVLALGSSRILQFRSGFINRNPDVFYNAAGPAWRLPDVLDFMKGLDDDALPEILILSVDLPWFHEGYGAGTGFDDVNDFENLFLVNRSFIQDVLEGERFDRDDFDTSAYLQRLEPGRGGLALGMRAIRDGHGFRSDGSEQYGDFLIAGWLWYEQQRQNHLDWMREGDEIYVFGDEFSEDRLNMLNDLLAFATERGIYVVGYLPPHMPSLWEEMEARGNHRFMDKLRDILPGVFEEYGYPFFDYSNGAWIGLTDDDFFDGWHVSELGNLRLYVHLLEFVPQLHAYSDREELLAIIDAANSTWEVFGMGSEPLAPSG